MLSLFISTDTPFNSIALSIAGKEIGNNPFCMAYPTKNKFAAIALPIREVANFVALIKCINCD